MEIHVSINYAIPPLWQYILQGDAAPCAAIPVTAFLWRVILNADSTLYFD